MRISDWSSDVCSSDLALMARILLALLLLAVATAPLRAAEPVAVPVRVGLHEGYGRIVFDWTRDVDYQARIDDGRLIVPFGEAAAFPEIGRATCRARVGQ